MQSLCKPKIRVPTTNDIKKEAVCMQQSVSPLTLWQWYADSLCYCPSVGFSSRYSQLQSHSSSGDEWCHLLSSSCLHSEQPGHQQGCSWLHRLSLCMEERATLSDAFHCLVFLATGAGWCWCQLEPALHVSDQSVVTSAQPYKNNLLFSRQEVVVILLCFFWLFFASWLTVLMMFHCST